MDKSAFSRLKFGFFTDTNEMYFTIDGEMLTEWEEEKALDYIFEDINEKLFEERFYKEKTKGRGGRKADPNKEIFLSSASTLTQIQMSYIKLYKMTFQLILAHPTTDDGKKMSVRKAVKIVYNSHPDEFPDWVEGSLNKNYYLGEGLTINSD